MAADHFGSQGPPVPPSPCLQTGCIIPVPPPGSLPLGRTLSRENSVPERVTGVKMPSNHLILHHPLFLPPSIFPRSGSFPISQFFTSGGQSIGASASASVLPILISFRIDWFDLLAFQGTLKSFLQHHISKASILVLSFLYSPTLTSIHDYWKTNSFDYTDLCLQSNVSAF